MVSFAPLASLASSSASSSSSTTTMTTAKRKPAKAKKPTYRPTGRGGAGNLKRSKSSSPIARTVSTLSMAGREIPLPLSGVSHTGRGGAGNTATHYLEPHVFKRVLAHEQDIVQSLKSSGEVVKSGRGGVGNITSQFRKGKRVSTLTGASTTHSVQDGDDVSLIASDSTTSFISGFDNNPYMRKRSMSVGSTMSSSSAYTGMQHEQSPTSSSVAASASTSTSSQIPSNYLLGRRLRPTPSIESMNSDEQSTATHDLFYLDPTPRPMSVQPHRTRPQSPQAIAPHLRLQRGGSSPGTVRPPSGMYIPLQTLGGLRPPSTLSEEPDAGNRESVFSARLSLSDFPLPPPSPAEYPFAPPQSAPSTQTSFVFMSTSPPRRSVELPQKPPPSGPLPVPPRRPPPSGPLPPIPSSPVTAQPPMSPTRGAFPQDDTIRAPRPMARPSLVGKLPPPAPLLSAPMSSTTPASTPGVRPPPSPSGYFRRRPSTAPISGPVPGSTYSPGQPLSASSSTSSFSGTENSPMSPAGSFRSSDSAKGVYTPAAAPEKTAALVRALSLDTTSTDSMRSSLDMNDSGSGSSENGVPPQQQPRSFFDDPLVDEPARTSRSSRSSSKSPYSPPQSPAPTRTSMDGKKRASTKGSDVDMRTKIALLAMRRDHKAANAMLFPRGAMGASSLRL